ncbi:MAG: potassium uptake protein, TrkH family, partial [Defluviitaleaceae bacterium]|nr:potassium uptake protein, TrkH family [Defluviitaleaceae bacterium]
LSIRKRKRLSPARVMFLGYIAVILAGAALLMLPVSHQAGAHVNFLAALFTATSATSVTGLVVVGTAQTWSFFGRVVILLMIQIGALGFMSFTTIFFFVMHKKIGLSQRLLITQSLNLHDIQGVIKLIRHVLIGTLIFQGIGAVLLWLRFWPRYGALGGLGMGIFHAVAAFANAGFDLFTYPDSGLMEQGDAFVLGVVMVLAFLGGIGFFVWEDVWQSRFRFKRLHLHSKLVLSISLCLIVGGWLVFFVVERHNPYSIGGMPLPGALYTSLFQVMMARSAGFTVVEQGQLLGATRMVVMILMLIGGSAGSTAGGIKNVTVGILFLSAISYFRGRQRLTVFRRTIPTAQIKSALAITALVLCATAAGAVTIALFQPYLNFSAVLFETVSAIATCGLSYGITGSLAPASKIVIILFMFCGRIGIMTLGMVAFFDRNKDEKIKHPTTWVMMG